MTILLRSLLFASLAAGLPAQMIDDGIMLDKGNLFAGYLYSHDSWDHYWEGTLNRVNGNLGTVTTETGSIYANYGLTNRVNIISNIPYVRTNASQGVLAGQSAYQDISIAAKYAFVDRPLPHIGSFRAIGVVSGAIPMTDYNPDFAPLSVGNQSTKVAGRLTLNLQTNSGFFVTATSAITSRSVVTLDRPYYYTNDHLYLTNQVQMPGVSDYSGALGYFRHGVMSNVAFTQQRTLGGGDIRRQDMPFISNRVNFSKIGALIMAPIPIKRFRNITPLFAYSHALGGRNTGESTTFSVGLFYTLHFHWRSPRP